MNKICLQCGHVGLPGREKRGSAGMELLIWSTVIIPGPFYSVWRRTGPRRACAACKNTELIPERSLAGRAWKEKHMLLEEDAPSVTPSAPALRVDGDGPIDPRNYRF